LAVFSGVGVALAALLLFGLAGLTAFPDLAMLSALLFTVLFVLHIVRHERIPHLAGRGCPYSAILLTV
jgi:hypothetical protein